MDDIIIMTNKGTVNYFKGYLADSSNLRDKGQPSTIFGHLNGYFKLVLACKTLYSF